MFDAACAGAALTCAGALILFGLGGDRLALIAGALFALVAIGSFIARLPRG